MKKHFFRMCPKCQAFFQDESLYTEHVAQCDGTDRSKEPVKEHPAKEEQPPTDEVEPEMENVLPLDHESIPDEKPKSKDKRGDT